MPYQDPGDNFFGYLSKREKRKLFDEMLKRGCTLPPQGLEMTNDHSGIEIDIDKVVEFARGLTEAPASLETQQRGSRISLCKGSIWLVKASGWLGSDGIGIGSWLDDRDPFLPLWDVHPAPKFIYSLDWPPEPRCIILSFDDGTMKMLSLVQEACDVPVTGKPFTGTKQQGLHLYNCSSFAIWNVQVSRLTGMVAYCGADGTVSRFQKSPYAPSDGEAVKEWLILGASLFVKPLKTPRMFSYTRLHASETQNNSDKQE
ncbi:hypothetical protein PTKIN_Ptkin14bG0112400 [Pterospermum kingtungense]